jgi:hypothetical protein
LLAGDRQQSVLSVPGIYLLVFDAAPQPLDEHVIPPGAFAVHADRNAVVGEQPVKA